MNNKNSWMSLLFELVMFTFLYMISDGNPYSLMFCGLSTLIFGVAFNLYLSDNLTDNNISKLMMLIIPTAAPHILFISSAASLVCLIISVLFIFTLIKIRKS